LNFAGSSNGGSWADSSNHTSFFDGAVNVSKYAKLVFGAITWSWRPEEEHRHMQHGCGFDEIVYKRFFAMLYRFCTKTHFA
jgi:hypothetical protein